MPKIPEDPEISQEEFEQEIKRQFYELPPAQRWQGVGNLTLPEALAVWGEKPMSSFVPTDTEIGVGSTSRPTLPDYVMRRPPQYRYLTKDHPWTDRASMLVPDDPDYPHEEIARSDAELEAVNKRARQRTKASPIFQPSVQGASGELTAEEAAEVAEFLGAKKYGRIPE